ncbi:hypothetical protein SDC9_180892 [bioreactor metagenome]|uniref:Uncharacterized protein n=1 Tax=bioreactor metagenome TaxID=1076179 RepID=A0A645H302_9ZZZZ
MPVFQIATLRPQRHHGKLGTVLLQNACCTLLCIAVPEKVHFVVADFYDIRLRKSPENLFFSLLRAVPEREAKVGVIGDQLTLLFGIGDRSLCGRARRLVGQAQCSEVEDPRLINEG